MTHTPAFRPSGARYLVLPDPVTGEEKQVGEYTISRDQDTHKKSSSGTVVAKGKLCSELNVGDRCSYGQYSGYSQTVEGREYLVLGESEILGELIQTPFDGPQGPHA
jgi:co-chaperonin GroES (HSP10)